MGLSKTGRVSDAAATFPPLIVGQQMRCHLSEIHRTYKALVTSICMYSNTKRITPGFTPEESMRKYIHKQVYTKAHTPHPHAHIYIYTSMILYYIVLYSFIL